LEHVTDFVGQICRLTLNDILTVNKNLTAARMAQCHKQTAQGCFTAAVMSQQRHKFSVLYLAIHILDYRLSAHISEIDILCF